MPDYVPLYVIIDRDRTVAVGPFDDRQKAMDYKSSPRYRDFASSLEVVMLIPPKES